MRFIYIAHPYRSEPAKNSLRVQTLAAEVHRLGIPVVVGDREAMGGGGVESLGSAGKTGRAGPCTRSQVSEK